MQDVTTSDNITTVETQGNLIGYRPSIIRSRSRRDHGGRRKNDIGLEIEFRLERLALGVEEIHRIGVTICEIEAIEFISATAATTRYGGGSLGGIIRVITRR